MNMRLSFLALVFSFAFFPFFAFAAEADLPAGFAPNSIWGSRTHIVAGDTINIFTVVYNSSDVPLAGVVGFTVDGKPVGVKNFSIKAGETQIESVPWTASVGTHSVFARIEKISNADTSVSASVLNRTTDTVTISVSEAPLPSSTAQAASSIASAVQAGLATALSMIKDSAQSVYSATESARNATIDALEKQIAKNENATPKKEVLGASTENKPASASTSSLFATAGTFISSAWKGILRGFLFVAKVKVFFYALLAFVVFMLFQLLRTWVRERGV